MIDYEMQWYVFAVAGVYFLRMEGGGFHLDKRVILTR